MEIQIQGQSRGIHYEGWEKQFIQCVFEEGEVQGKNERYEFRCDAKLECCGRVCCTPQQEVIPLWLMILFIILALLLLLAILGTIAYLCAKRRKMKPKKMRFAVKDNSNVAYASLSKDGKSSSGADKDRALLAQESENYSSPDFYRNGYRNDGYGRGDGGAGFDRDGYGRNGAGYGRDGYGRGGYGGAEAGYGRGGPGGAGYGRGGYGGEDGSDGGSRRGVHETFESSYKEEIVYEKAKFVPSPMSEETLSAPKPVRIVQHSADEISRMIQSEEAELVVPPAQRAQLAFHRPFVPDPMEESEYPSPLRHSASYHSAAEISTSQSVTYSTVDKPQGKLAEVMFTRPGFDNVPSY
ncbi:hypothetical protein PFISCL1PPCAC_25412 [Pristionchus fissidentatus]|uniref:CX domain-containing protein n=1 Tax=Pristionchus fissidentatus TaxID=1538716 RepID=A0AAV5WRA7_9BILA|nr:hypothetical protein PFISCL1PPCAC_25412 [Pristionchus fissidentatus]